MSASQTVDDAIKNAQFAVVSAIVRRMMKGENIGRWFHGLSIDKC